MLPHTPPSTLHPPAALVAKAVAVALEEDLGGAGDLTAGLLPATAQVSGVLMSRSLGILAGTACAAEAFRQVDPDVKVVWLASDGQRVAKKGTIAEISGKLASICTAERTALNFLTHLSGIASHTRRFVDIAAIAEQKIEILDTRKTTPGLRAFEKAAVRAGGGRNHRFGLSDLIMLKDNHLTVLDIAEAVSTARQRHPHLKVQVECDTIEQARQALEAGADALLLDNMAPETITEIAAVNRSLRPDNPAYLEISGGITLDNISNYLDLGANAISTSALVAQAPALDIGLDIAMQA